MTRTKWSAQLVTDKIKALHKSGSRLDTTYAKKNLRSLLWASNRYHGSWRTAVESAGVDYDFVMLIAKRTSWDKKRIKREILELHAQGEPLNSNHAQTKHPKLYMAAVKKLGSWEKAITDAGLDYFNFRKVPPHRARTKARVIQDIQQRIEDGLPLNGGVVSKKAGALANAAKVAFPGKKSWERALIAAGVDPDSLEDSRVIWDKEAVQDAIRRRHHQKLPLYKFYLDKHKLGGLTGAGERIFGSWRKAVESCDIDYETIRGSRYNYWGPKIVIREIRALEKTGVKLSLKVTQQSRADLVGAAIRYFGTWGLAVEAAGFDYNEHCQVYSTKHWMAMLSDADYSQILTTGRRMDIKPRRSPKKRRKKK